MVAKHQATIHKELYIHNLCENLRQLGSAFIL